MWWPHSTHAHSVMPPLTSTVKSSLFVHGHSSPLSLAACYIDVTQTVLVILTVAVLFPDRPCMSVLTTLLLSHHTLSLSSENYFNDKHPFTLSGTTPFMKNCMKKAIMCLLGTCLCRPCNGHVKTVPQCCSWVAGINYSPAPASSCENVLEM